MSWVTLLDDRVGLPAPRRAELERALAEHATLSDVVRWMAEVGGVELVSIVEQDEFTNDVVLRWSDGLYLVYDCT